MIASPEDNTEQESEENEETVASKPPEQSTEMSGDGHEMIDNQALIEQVGTHRDQGDELLEEYQQMLAVEETAPPIQSEKLVTIATSVWERGELQPGQAKETVEKCKRPSNLETITVTNCNPEIYKILPKNQRSTEQKLRQAQTFAAHAAVPLIQIQDALCRDEVQKQEIMAKTMDAITLIANTSRNINQYRRDAIRPVLDYKIQPLCTKAHKPPEGQWLFGHDFLKRVKATQETTTIGRKRSSHVYSGRVRKRYPPQTARRHRRRLPRRPPHGKTDLQILSDETGAIESDPQKQTLNPPIPFACRLDLAVQQPSQEKEDQELEELSSEHQVHKSLVGTFDNDFVKFLDQHDQKPFKAGSIKLCYQKWLEMTSDKAVLQYVAGMRIEFVEPPDSVKNKHPIQFSPEEHVVVKQEIETLLKKGVIEQVEHCQDEVISNIFTRQKRDSESYRVILNLSALNENIEFIHFKMDTLQTALNLIYKDCFCATIDLSDAYYSVPIHTQDRKYLRFQYQQNLYEFTCLPNGLSPGPRAFTKLLKPPLATLRRRYGITIMSYLDDSIVIGKTLEQVVFGVQKTVELFAELGFKISTKKSRFLPSQNIEFLGFAINTKCMTVTLLEAKAHRLISSCQALLDDNKVKIRQIAQALGYMTASLPANAFAKLYAKKLERFKIKALKQAKGNFDSEVVLDKESKSDLDWWIANAKKLEKQINTPEPTVIIYTDASKQGWGCYFPREKTSTAGRWTVEEQQLHINALELYAVLFSLQAMLNTVHDAHVRVMTDNTVTMLNINNQGSTKSTTCNEIARKIWNWCTARSNWISAAHCPGELNVQADEASRKFNDDTEWSLGKPEFVKICKRFGTPAVDAFASRLNKKVARYYAWKPDPNALAIDAFTVSWTFEFIYAFPPFSMVGATIRKFKQDGGGGGILVVPLWQNQPWFNGLMDMVVAPPLLLKANRDNIRLEHNHDIQHPLMKHLYIIVCKCSNNRLMQEAFRQTCTEYSKQPENLAPGHSTVSIWPDGRNIVCNKVLIPLDLNWLKP